MKNILLLGLTILIFLYGCKDNSTNPELSNELIPLKIGNSWEYIRYEYNVTYTDTNEYTRTILRDTVINGRKWFIDNFGAVARNGSEGYYTWSKNTHQQNLLYKYPGIKGDTSYSLNEIVFQGNLVSEKVAGTIRSVDTLIQTKSNSYSCFKYVFPLTHNNLGGSGYWTEREISIAPGIGEIQINIYGEDSQDNLELYQTVVLKKANIK